MNTVFINGAGWETVWTTHAISRTYDRRSHPKIAEANLVKLLSELDCMIPNLIDELGDVAIVRSFIDLTYYIVSPKKAEKKIKIITYGDIGTTFPKVGDKVFTVFPNGDVGSVRWHTSYNKDSTARIWGNLMVG